MRVCCELSRRKMNHRRDLSVLRWRCTNDPWAKRATTKGSFKRRAYIGRRLLNRIISFPLRNVSNNPIQLYIHINYLVPNIFVRLPSYNSTAKMRRCCLTCEDHKNKPSDHRRSHCANRRNHSTLQLTDSGRWLKFRFTVFAWTRHVNRVPGKFLFAQRSHSWYQKSKEPKDIFNFHSYQSIKGFYFMSLFPPNQSYQKVIITSSGE